MSSIEPICVLETGHYLPEYILRTNELTELQTKGAEYAISKLGDLELTENKEKAAKIIANKDWVIKTAKHSNIDERHCELPDGCKTLISFYQKYDWNPPYTVRAQIYRQKAPQMSIRAINNLLTGFSKKFGNKVGQNILNKVTHIVSHTTSGWSVPGLSHEIITKLGLSSTVRPISIPYIGCAGSGQLMYIANQIASANKDSLILIVSAEILTTLGRLYNDNISLNKSVYIPNILFGDGASAMLIGNNYYLEKVLKLDLFNKNVWYFGDKFGSHTIPNTDKVLSIEVSTEYGQYYSNVIGKEIPYYLNKTMNKTFDSWFNKSVGSNIEYSECEYAIHPGGYTIVKNFGLMLENKYGIKNASEKIKESFENLRLCGNMASVDLFLIIEDIIKNKENVKNDMLYIAMGPGISFEYGALKKYDFYYKKSSNKINYLSAVIVAILAIFVILSMFIW